MRGRCVAGLRADGAGWVRPVAPETNHGQLFSRHFQLDDRSEPRALDLISLNLVQAQPAAGQPENWVIGKERWKLKARPLGPDLHSRLREAIAKGPLLLGSTQTRVSAAESLQLTASLALVQPANLQGYLKREPYQLPQPRVLFGLDTQKYDLPFTDPAWAARIIRNLSAEEPASPGQKLGISNHSPVLLTVSLSEPFNGYCYKLAAAIVEIPGF